MARVPNLDLHELSTEQRRLYDEIARPRGGVVAGPFAIWLRNPELADRMNQAGNAIRVKGNLDKRLFELMVLLVARHCSAQYEWYAHEQSAIKAGVADDVVDAIRARRVPSFARDDERLVYDVVMELNEAKTLSQATYDRALSLLGLELLIELVTAAGFYTLVAMVLNAFDAPVPNGSRPLP